jgi:hypothetical protein
MIAYLGNSVVDGTTSPRNAYVFHPEARLVPPSYFGDVLDQGLYPTYNGFQWMVPWVT